MTNIKYLYYGRGKDIPDDILEYTTRTHSRPCSTAQFLECTENWEVDIFRKVLGISLWQLKNETKFRFSILCNHPVIVGTLADGTEHIWMNC